MHIRLRYVNNGKVRLNPSVSQKVCLATWGQSQDVCVSISEVSCIWVGAYTGWEKLLECLIQSFLKLWSSSSPSLCLGSRTSELPVKRLGSPGGRESEANWACWFIFDASKLFLLHAACVIVPFFSNCFHIHILWVWKMQFISLK